VFNLALEYKKFYKVGIGATLGFAVIVTIGILFGSIITEFVPLGLISLISGLLFIAIGLIELRNIKSLYLNERSIKSDSKNKIYAAPIEVWLGAFLALTSVAWIGIFAGAAIAKKVPKFYLKVVAVSIFILVGVLVLISAF